MHITGLCADLISTNSTLGWKVDFGFKWLKCLKSCAYISPRKKPQYILNIPEVLSGCLLQSKLVAKTPLCSLLSNPSSKVGPASRSWVAVLNPGCIKVLNRVKGIEQSVFPWRIQPSNIDPKAKAWVPCKACREKTSFRASFTDSSSCPLASAHVGSAIHTLTIPLQGNELLLSCLFMRIFCLSRLRTCSWSCRTNNSTKWIQTREHLKCQYYLGCQRQSTLLGLFSCYFAIRDSN